MVRQPELRRVLHLKQGVALAIGAVLGPSILVLPALVAQQAGPASLVAWIIMSLVALALACTLGRLGARFPHAGGLAAYAQAAFGTEAGSVAGWFFLGSVPLAVPIIALVGAGYLGQLWHASSWMIVGLAALLVALSLALNALGLRLASWTQVSVVGTLLLLLVLALIAGFAHPQPDAFTPFLPAGWVAVGRAAITIFWSYIGFEMMIPLAEEFTSPARDVPASLILAALVLALLYLAVATATVLSKSYGEATGHAPFSTMIATTFGGAAGNLTALIGVGCAFITIHTNIAGFARLLYAQARAGSLPQSLGALHPRTHIPTTALLVQACAFGVIFILIGCFQPPLGELIRWAGVNFLMLYLLSMIAALKLLPPRDVGRFTAILTLGVCLVLYPLSGWACLSPLLLLLVGIALTTIQKYLLHKKTMNSLYNHTLGKGKEL